MYIHNVLHVCAENCNRDMCSMLLNDVIFVHLTMMSHVREEERGRRPSSLDLVYTANLVARGMD